MWPFKQKPVFGQFCGFRRSAYFVNFKKLLRVSQCTSNTTSIQLVYVVPTSFVYESSNRRILSYGSEDTARGNESLSAINVGVNVGKVGRRV